MSKGKNPNTSGGTDYDVGYGKPPVRTRFKPGQSGNPQGRPKGVRNFGTDVKATLKAPVKVTCDGRSRKVSTQEAALMRLREKALGGDARALDRLLNLAQVHNQEDTAAAAAECLGADDAMMLQVYNARLLSGAAAGPETVQTNRGISDASTDKPSAESEGDPENLATNEGEGT